MRGSWGGGAGVPPSIPGSDGPAVGGGEGEVSWEDVRRRRHEEEDFPRQAAKVKYNMDGQNV